MNWDQVFAVAGVWEEGVATFNGSWEVEQPTKFWERGRTFNIAGTRMTVSDGRQLSVIITNDEKGYLCSHMHGADLYTGRLREDNRKIDWSDGSIWNRVGDVQVEKIRKEAEDRAMAPGNEPAWQQDDEILDAAMRKQDKPCLSLVQVLRLQEELCVAFMDADFQSRLEQLEATHGKASAQLSSEHKQLFLTVEDVILPRYGLETGQKGVRQMLAAFDRFSDVEDVKANLSMMRETLGLEVVEECPVQEVEAGVGLPPSTGAGDATRPRTEQAPAVEQECIEVVVRHLTEDVQVVVQVPWRATFYDVKEAAYQKTGRAEIMKSSLMMKDGEEGTYSAFEDRERVGKVRLVLCKAGLRARTRKSEEQQQPQRRPGEQVPHALREARNAVAACRKYLEERHQTGRQHKEQQLQQLSRQNQEAQRSRELESRRRLPLEEQRRLEIDERRRKASPGVVPNEAVHGEAAAAAPASRAGVQLERARRARDGGAKRFLVLGGEDGSNHHDSTEMLDMVAMVFNPGPRMGAQRSSFAGVSLQEGQVLVVGGSVGSQCLETVEVLDLETMSFSAGPRMSQRRAACAAAKISNRQVLVLGGRDRSSRLDSTEVLNLDSMTFAPGPRMARRRSMCAALMLDQQRLLVMGGHDGSSALDSTEVLDVRTMTFSKGPRMGAERFSCAVSMVDQWHLLVLGGVGTGNTRLASTEVFDVKDMTFSPGPSMGIPRSGCAAMALDEQRLLVAGGFDGSNRHDSTEVLDLAEWTFTRGPQLGLPRGGCVAVCCS